MTHPECQRSDDTSGIWEGPVDISYMYKDNKRGLCEFPKKIGEPPMSTPHYGPYTHPECQRSDDTSGIWEGPVDISYMYKDNKRGLCEFPKKIGEPPMSTPHYGPYTDPECQRSDGHIQEMESQ